MSSFLRPYLYWGLAGFFYLYEMVLRASCSVLANDLRYSFELDAQELGLLSAAYYWAYTPLQIPCGLILDKVGPHVLISGSCALCAVGALLFGTTSSFGVAFFARFLIGAGSACAFISTLMLVMGWFAPRHFSIMAGLTNLMGCVGGTFAGQPLAFLAEKVGWKNAMIQLGWAGVGLATLIFFLLRDPVTEKKPSLSLITLLKEVGSKKQVWLAGIIGGLLYLPISAFAELWAVPFVQATYGISAEKASFISMAVYIGMGMGSPFMAALCQKWSYRRVLLWVSSLSSVLFGFIAVDPMHSFAYCLVLSALAGFVLGGQVLVFSLAKEAVEPHQAGTASAVTNAIIMAFGLIFQPLLGSILTMTWKIFGGTLDKGLPFYTPLMYQYAILVLPICFAVSFFLSKKLKKS